MSFITINNCEACPHAPCHKVWPVEHCAEARKLLQDGFSKVSENMTFDKALEIASLAKNLELPFVFEIKQSETNQNGAFDFYIPNRFMDTEPVSFVAVAIGDGTLEHIRSLQNPKIY